MNKSQPNIAKIVFTIVGILIAIFLVITFFPIVIIGPGQRGVVFNNGTGVEDRVLGEGIHLRIPLLESVTALSIRVQKTDVKAEAASKDLQTVDTDIVVNWHMDASAVNKIYQQIGDEEAVDDRVLTPAVNEVVKAAVAKKTANDVLAQRPVLKEDIDIALSQRLKRYHIMLDDVSIVNVEFTAEFNKAIEDKQIAQQQAEQAKFLVDKARSEAEANKIQQQTLSPEILQQRALDKWDGKLPQYFSGSSLPFISVSK